MKNKAFLTRTLLTCACVCALALGTVSLDDVTVAKADTTHTHKSCGQTICAHESSAHSEEVEYTAISSKAFAETVYSTVNEVESYYLDVDTTMGGIYIANGKTLNLCLNGKTLTLSGYIGGSGKLNVCDCGLSGKIDTTSYYSVSDGGEINMYGGTFVSSFSASSPMAAVNLRGTSTFNMYGGTLNANKYAFEDTDGTNAVVNIYDGVITAGKSVVYCTNTVNIYGGEMTQTEAYTSGQYTFAPLVVRGEMAKANIYGGTLKGTGTGTYGIDVLEGGNVNITVNSNDDLLVQGVAGAICMEKTKANVVLNGGTYKGKISHGVASGVLKVKGAPTFDTSISTSKFGKNNEGEYPFDFSEFTGEATFKYTWNELKKGDVFCLGRAENLTYESSWSSNSFLYKSESGWGFVNAKDEDEKDVVAIGHIAHSYTDDCDAICNDGNCNEERVPPHRYSSDCDTTCDVEGCTGTRVVTAVHTPEEDDGDCTTAIVCSVCGEVVTEGQEHHDFSGEYESDENGHWHKCQNCETVEESQTHTPEEDDGDCTTAIICSVCEYVTTAAETAHTYGAWGDWTDNADGTQTKSATCECGKCLRISAPKQTGVAHDGLQKEALTLGDELALKIEKDESKIAEVEKASIKEQVTAEKLLFVDVTITNVTKKELVTTTTTVIELMIEFESANKTNIAVYRNHAGAIRKFVALAARPTADFIDGSFFVDEAQGCIYVYSNQFSTYGVGYDDEKIITEMPPIVEDAVTPDEEGIDYKGIISTSMWLFIIALIITVLLMVASVVSFASKGGGE